MLPFYRKWQSKLEEEKPGVVYTLVSKGVGNSTRGKVRTKVVTYVHGSADLRRFLNGPTRGFAVRALHDVHMYVCILAGCGHAKAGAAGREAHVRDRAGEQEDVGTAQEGQTGTELYQNPWDTGAKVNAPI